ARRPFCGDPRCDPSRRAAIPATAGQLDRWTHRSGASASVRSGNQHLDSGRRRYAVVVVLRNCVRAVRPRTARARAWRIIMAHRREKSAPRQEPVSATETAAPPLSAPRFAFGWAALVYALGTLSLGYPALVGKFLVNPHSDQYIAGYAFREFAATMLKTTGHFPLWNPYLFGGL